jgi:hypothetical protein
MHNAPLFETSGAEYHSRTSSLVIKIAIRPAGTLLAKNARSRKNNPKSVTLRVRKMGHLYLSGLLMRIPPATRLNRRSHRLAAAEIRVVAIRTLMVLPTMTRTVGLSRLVVPISSRISSVLNILRMALILHIVDILLDLLFRSTTAILDTTRRRRRSIRILCRRILATSARMENFIHGLS